MQLLNTDIGNSHLCEGMAEQPIGLRPLAKFCHRPHDSISHRFSSGVIEKLCSFALLQIKKLVQGRVSAFLILSFNLCTLLLVLFILSLNPHTSRACRAANL